MQRITYKISLTFITIFFVFNFLYANNESSIIYHNQDSLTDNSSISKRLIDLANNFAGISPSLSLEVISKALDYAKESNDSELIANCNQLKGIFLINNGFGKSGISHLKNALTYYEGNDKNYHTTPILVELAKGYQSENQFKKSQIFLNSAIADYSLVDDSLGIVDCLTILGYSYKQLNMYDDAYNTFNIALKSSIINGYTLLHISNLLNISELEIETGDLSVVHEKIISAITISKLKEFKELEVRSYFLMSQYYHKENNIEAATEYLIKSNQLKSEISSIKAKKLEKLLVKLSSNNSNVEDTNLFSLIIEAIFILMLLASIIYVLLKYRKQNKVHTEKLKKCSKEIKAFIVSVNNLEAKIEEATQYRIDEISEEIKRNNTDQTKLINSSNNLNKVNHLKDMFLSKISHEIRTPLSGILGFAEILETQLALMDENDLFEFASSIRDSGLSLVLLLNNILDISRLNSNNMKLNIELLSPSILINRVVDDFNKEASLKGVKLIYDSSSIPDIQTDDQVCSKILSLILSNSVKFTEKGFIKINHDLDEENNQIKIYIKDTGIGIDKVYIDQVFEPYRQESLGYSTSYQGAGLGLPLSKKMAHKLGGDISISSQKGVGTTVTIILPVEHKKQEEEVIINEPIIIDKQPKLVGLPWENASILVVEDDKMNQLLYEKMLKNAKHLDIAKDGKVALALIEKSINENTYDLVLMDINLPAPWTGISLTKEIRKRWEVYKNIPFIAQTAYALSGNRETMLEEGFDEYITKPIIKSTLKKVISIFLDNKES